MQAFAAELAAAELQSNLLATFLNTRALIRRIADASKVHMVVLGLSWDVGTMCQQLAQNLLQMLRRAAPRRLSTEAVDKGGIGIACWRG